MIGYKKEVNYCVRFSVEGKNKKSATFDKRREQGSGTSKITWIWLFYDRHDVNEPFLCHYYGRYVRTTPTSYWRGLNDYCFRYLLHDLPTDSSRKASLIEYTVVTVANERTYQFQTWDIQQ